MLNQNLSSQAAALIIAIGAISVASAQTQMPAGNNAAKPAPDQLPAAKATDQAPAAAVTTPTEQAAPAISPSAGGTTTVAPETQPTAAPDPTMAGVKKHRHHKKHPAAS